MRKQVYKIQYMQLHLAFAHDMSHNHGDKIEALGQNSHCDSLMSVTGPPIVGQTEVVWR